MQTSSYLQGIFDCLEQFKNLPTYQFERRIDAFLLPYLEPAINNKYKDYANDFKLIYPEFPLWPKKKEKDELDKSAKRSVYVDYVMYSKQKNLVLFVELKTDKKSVSKSQIETYELNIKEGWKTLFLDLFDKAIHSSKNSGSWRKYFYALDYIYSKAPELTGFSKPLNLQQFYRKARGQGATNYLMELRENLNFTNLPTIALIFIAPEDALDKVQINLSDGIGESERLFTLKNFSENTVTPLNALLQNMT